MDGSSTPKTKKTYDLTNSEGSADRLTQFYARLDKDFFFTKPWNSKTVQQKPIIATKQEIINVFNAICTNKTGPDKISTLILKRCLSSLLYIAHRFFNRSLSACKFTSP